MARGIPQFVDTAIDAAFAVINSMRSHTLLSHQASRETRRKRTVRRHKTWCVEAAASWRGPPLVCSDELSDQSMGSEQSRLCFYRVSALEIRAEDHPCECCSAESTSSRYGATTSLVS
jgi:hypothetical protein